MRRITIDALQENFLHIISKEWMLVTAGTPGHFNTMTANWGGTGFLWNRPVVFVFIRPERFTYEFMESNEYFTLSFLGEENKAIHKICGSLSGRDIDKIKESGLCPLIMENNQITYKQSRLTLECKKLYDTMLNQKNFTDKVPLGQWYGGTHGNLHKMYIAEITDIWIKE